MYKINEDNTYSFTSNRVNYTLEKLDDSIELYETDNPVNTGFVFENMKQFILFINDITDIAEEIEEKNETE